MERSSLAQAVRAASLALDAGLLHGGTPAAVAAALRARVDLALGGSGGSGSAPSSITRAAAAAAASLYANVS
jgi:hypothetical protein